MARSFNTAGPNDPADHYTLPVMARLPDVRRLIEKKRYFVLHAPRHVDKTTTLLSLGRELTAEGRYVAVLLPMEQGAPFPDDLGAAELAILESWRGWTAAWLPPELQPPPWPDAPPGSRLGAALRAWAEAAPRPLAVFLDEIDALQDNALTSALRQIRAGYPTRPGHFPWSLALIGPRDVRDYKVASGSAGRLGTASPFNIKAESLTMRNFTSDEVAELYGQHTGETGQVFLPEAVEREPLLASAPYQEIAPHLVLMAFLHRVVNGGSIEREYAIGRGRMDLIVRYRGEALAIEIKVWRPAETDPLKEGLEQIDGYLAGLGLTTGWLVIFDRRPDAPPLAERLSAAPATTPGGGR